MSRDVFISYARKTNRAQAQALSRELGDDTCFLDLKDIEYGAEFPRVLVDALLASRLFVAFIDDQYLRRWYCVREWMLARAGHDELLRRGNSAVGQALDHIVLAFPAAGFDSRVLPPGLRTINWPLAEDTVALAALVRQKLNGPLVTLSEQLKRHGVTEENQAAMIAQAVLPPPRNLSAMPTYPKAFPPSMEQDFVGRANDIWRLHTMLKEGRMDLLCSAATVAVQGVGGIGKTQLVREYAHRFGPTDYSGGVFWIDASESEPLDRQFHGILTELRRDVPSIDDMRALGRNVRAELEIALHDDTTQKSFLIVVDNVPEPQTGTPPLALSHWCPALGKATCIATSRKRLGNAATYSIEIDALDPTSATMLLQRDITSARRHSLAQHEWEAITEWVGRLPLALTLLNAALRLGAIFPKQLSEARTSDATSVLDHQMDALRDSVSAGTLRGVTEAFALSYQILAEDSKALARRLARFAPAPIPDELLLAISTEKSRVALIDRSFLTDALAGLANAPSSRQMHRLLSDFIRTQDGNVRIETLDALRAVKLVLQNLNLDKTLDRALGLALIPHIWAVTRYLDKPEASTTPDIVTKHQWESTNEIADFVRELGYRAGEHATIECSVDIYRKALILATQAPPAWALTQSRLGISLTILGENEEGMVRVYEAVSAFQSALTVFSRSRRPADWATTQMHLGIALAMLGRGPGGTQSLVDAVSAFRAALEFLTVSTSPDAWADIQHNLGNTLCLVGEYETGTSRFLDAVPAFKAALQVRTRKKRPIAWAETQNSLARALQALGEREEGSTHLLEAISTCRVALKSLTRDIAPVPWAMTQNNLGNALATLGERKSESSMLSEAVVAYRAALEVQEHIGARLVWADTRANLGNALYCLGCRLGGSETLLESVSVLRSVLEFFQNAGPAWTLRRNNVERSLAGAEQALRDR